MFQTVVLTGIAFSQSKIGIIYLALIPPIFSLYVSRNGQSSVISRKKSIVLVLIACSTYLFFHNTYRENLLFNYEGVVLISFIFWSMALFYNPFKTRRSDDEKDRLFFHDMVNHTHAINLFLSNRVSLKKGLDHEECRALIGEVKTMQSLFKGHFGLTHRDLVNPYEYVGFDFAKEGIVNLVRSFLPAHLVECKFSYHGLLKEPNVECVIHYPTISRVLTNLIKNVSESRSNDVEIDFDYRDDGLHMTVKNRVFNLDNDSMDLSSDLKKIILAAPRSERDQKMRGIGLESVSNICKESGGSFNFGVEQGYWISEIFLPRFQMVKKAA